MKGSRHILALSVMAVVVLIAVEATAADRRARRSHQPVTAREPVENLRGTTLVAGSGKATIISSGRRTTVRLRRGERLNEIAETGRGWVAAGLREESGGTGLVVMRRSASRGGTDRLPSPDSDKGFYRAAPRILVERDELAGLAWLEGERPDRMTVRAAQWNGAGWIDSVEVAGLAPGSQTGLAQAVLADGSWLLVWSRFDGRENDLYWSRRTGGNWTPAMRLEPSDGVPDVTPTLLATADGALLAWSEYDGHDYRLRAARFAGGGWRRLSVDAGPGVLQPKFIRQATGAWVLVRTALPRGWAALEIRTDGSAGRLARVETTALDRPLLRPTGSGMAFDWAGARQGDGDGDGRWSRWETQR